MGEADRAHGLLGRPADRVLSRCTNDYVESLWWILKQYWDRGLIYQGYKVVPYCPRCGTPLSSHELAQGYQEGTKDPSVFVKFPLRDQPGVYLLVWTTTPWTLPGNVAVAVGEDIDYVLVEHGDDKLWLAEALLGKVFGEHAEPREGAAAGEGHASCWGCTISRSTPSCPSRRTTATSSPATSSAPRTARAWSTSRRPSAPTTWRSGSKYDLPTLMTVDAQGRFIDAVDAVARHLRQGRRPADPAGADRPRADVQAGRLRAHLPVLLALRHAAALLRAHHLVHQDDRVQGPAAREQRADQLGAGAYPGWALRRMAGEQHRLGPGARALLGHAAAVLGVRQPGVRAPGVRRLGGRAERRRRGASS